MARRSTFPPVFWVANSVEILERFAYYGIYMGFGIYMQSLHFSESKLGVVQSLFLLVSYMVPVISGTFADRFGFKKVLIVSYLAYLPSILLLLVTKTFSGIALTMLSIALAAGIFKPLISGTVRAVTDKTNKTLGFGVFYAMVNVGASFGPIVAGKLRAISWGYAFLAAAIGIVLMLIITIFFYKEPEREIEGVTLKQKFRDMGIALSDVKFSVFLILLGVFFWLPFWAFFNLLAMYIDKYLDTAVLYNNVKSIIGPLVNVISHTDQAGKHRILGETIAHTGFIIMILQIFVSRIAEKFKAMSTFLFGLLIAGAGFALIGYSRATAPAVVFLGILLFAIGEMISSPRIQEYITWIAPKEKVGLYMGSNFLAIGLGGMLSGMTYTSLYGHFCPKDVDNLQLHHPEYVWYILGAHVIFGLIVIFLFTKFWGEFKELDE